MKPPFSQSFWLHGIEPFPSIWYVSDLSGPRGGARYVWENHSTRWTVKTKKVTRWCLWLNISSGLDGVITRETSRRKRRGPAIQKFGSWQMLAMETRWLFQSKLRKFEQCSKSLSYSIILSGFFGISPLDHYNPKYVKGSIIHELIINQPSFISHIHQYVHIFLIKIPINPISSGF